MDIFTDAQTGVKSAVELAYPEQPRAQLKQQSSVASLLQEFSENGEVNGYIYLHVSRIYYLDILHKFCAPWYI